MLDNDSTSLESGKTPKLILPFSGIQAIQVKKKTENVAQKNEKSQWALSLIKSEVHTKRRKCN